MIDKNTIAALDFENLSEKYALANTPMFLYKNFQRNQSIANLSTFPTGVLIKCFESYYPSRDRSMEDVITLYALLIALTFKYDLDAQDFFTNLSKYQLRWASKIADIYHSNFTVMNNLHFENPVKPQIRIESYSTSNYESFKF